MSNLISVTYYLYLIILISNCQVFDSTILIWFFCSSSLRFSFNLPKNCGRVCLRELTRLLLTSLSLSIIFPSSFKSRFSFHQASYVVRHVSHRIEAETRLCWPLRALIKEMTHGGVNQLIAAYGVASVPLYFRPISLRTCCISSYVPSIS